jgi:hypothetical protein
MFSASGAKPPDFNGIHRLSPWIPMMASPSLSWGPFHQLLDAPMIILKKLCWIMQLHLTLFSCDHDLGLVSTLLLDVRHDTVPLGHLRPPKSILLFWTDMFPRIRHVFLAAAPNFTDANRSPAWRQLPFPRRRLPSVTTAVRCRDGCERNECSSRYPCRHTWKHVAVSVPYIFCHDGVVRDGRQTEAWKHGLGVCNIRRLGS